MLSHRLMWCAEGPVASVSGPIAVLHAFRVFAGRDSRWVGADAASFTAAHRHNCLPKHSWLYVLQPDGSSSPGSRLAVARTPVTLS